MTKCRSTWLGLVSAVFYAAVLVVSSVRPQSVATSSCTEFAEHPGCPEVEGKGNRLVRFARLLINRIQNIDAVIQSLRKEQANDYSHKDSHLITAYAPAFFPV